MRPAVATMIALAAVAGLVLIAVSVACTWRDIPRGDSGTDGAATIGVQVHTPGAFEGGGYLPWADVRYRRGWRIQHNVETGRYRLVDPRGVLRAAGTFADVAGALETVEPKAAQRTGHHAVIMVHGLLGTTHSFDAIGAELERRGYDPIAVSYASSRRTVEEVVGDLDRLLAGLDGYDRVSFVTHSMGGLVVRVLLARRGAWTERFKVSRVVMLVPPNQGAQLAELAGDTDLFRTALGPAGADLRAAAARSLPGLDVPFGVIAGYSPQVRELVDLFVAGPNDGLVAVRETRLAGMQDFMVVEADHFGMLDHDDTVQATANFLDSGRFSPPARRHETTMETLR